MLLEKPGTGETDSAAPLSREARWSAQVRTLLQGVRSAFRHKWVWSAVCALTAGLALRIVWIVFWADFDGDSEVYAIIARNMLLHHAYALDNPFHLTLIRLPGYPVFMAVIFSVFGMMNYYAVRYVQAFVDMGSCLLLAGFVRDHVSRRAALVTLWIACLCPFTANYTAVPLTECPAIFSVALGLFAAGKLIRSINIRTDVSRANGLAAADGCGADLRD